MIFLAIPGPVNAAGLGKLVVLSALGEPLHAEIDLLSVGDAAVAGLRLRLASPLAYQVADYRYNPVLASSRLVVKQEANGRRYIEISSTQSLYEPFIQLLIELDWNATRMVRGYTALIDPHGYAPPVAPLSSSVSTRSRASAASSTSSSTAPTRRS